MSARSRRPDTESLGMESRSVLASSRLQTGVLPFLTTYFGPRTECAGFVGVICRTTRKSYRIKCAPRKVLQKIKRPALKYEKVRESTMTKLETVLYTAKAYTTGGRA